MYHAHASHLPYRKNPSDTIVAAAPLIDKKIGGASLDYPLRSQCVTMDPGTDLFLNGVFHHRMDFHCTSVDVVIARACQVVEYLAVHSDMVHCSKFYDDLLDRTLHLRLDAHSRIDHHISLIHNMNCDGVL